MSQTPRELTPCKISDKFKFKWIQLIHAIPKLWKDSLAFDNGNSNNLFIQDHHLLKKTSDIVPRETKQQGDLSFAGYY